MGILKSTATRLEKFDEGVQAAKESFNAQTALNITLAIGVVVALLVAAVAIGRTRA